jgi:diguanylate cyclase (GGDEF)-like protein
MNQPALSHATRPKKRRTLQGIFRRTHLLVLLITLLISGTALSVLSFFALEDYAKKNLQLLANSVSYRVEAGVVFNDREAIQETINQLADRDEFSTIRVVNRKGSILAEFTHNSTQSLNWWEELFNRFIFAEPVTEAIMHGNQKVGTVWVSGNASVISHFLGQVLIGLISCLLITLLCVSYFSYRTHAKIVKSFATMTTVANLVREQRAFNIRLPEANIVELNELSQDFNSLLDEIEQWHLSLKQENDELALRALHDSLTGLPNRGFFEKRLESSFNQAKNSIPLALLFIDNDRFKQINDTYGHAAGDQVLTEMSRRLQGRLRQKDFVARLGGDEFAVILPHIMDEQHAIMVAESLLATAQLPVQLDDQRQVQFYLSIGIALSTHCDSPQQLLAKADAAMYQAKLVTTNSWYLAD